MRKNEIIFDFPCSETFREYEAELNGKERVIIYQAEKVKPLDDIKFEKLKRLKMDTLKSEWLKDVYNSVSTY